MRIDCILPNLFVGSCPKGSEDIDRLRREFGVTAVLSVQTNDDLRCWGICWEKMQARYERSGIVVRRVPVRDFDSDDLCRMLSKCVGVLDELLREGYSVFLHCNVGVNRSPTVAVGYLCWVKGWAVEKAAGHVRRHHLCDPYVAAIRRADEEKRGGWQDSQ